MHFIFGCEVSLKVSRLLPTFAMIFAHFSSTGMTGNICYCMHNCSPKGDTTEVKNDPHWHNARSHYDAPTCKIRKTILMLTLRNSIL